MTAPSKKIFLCYAFADEPFVLRVYEYLVRQPDIEPYCWHEKRRADEWPEQVDDAVRESDAFVAFIGEKIGATQRDEAVLARTHKRLRIRVDLSPGASTHAAELQLERVDPIVVGERSEEIAMDCARQIVVQLRLDWIPYDGLPDELLFDYEKDIVKAYAKSTRLPIGCPSSWPEMERRFDPTRESKLEAVIGRYRADGARILVDARAAVEEGATVRTLTLPEAGPREQLSFPRHGGDLTVGIVVSGGIAPGINAVIESIVERHVLYQDKDADGGYTLTILGYLGGLKALIGRRGAARSMVLTEKSEPVAAAREIANRGGSILATSRADELIDEDPRKREQLLKRIFGTLDSDHVDILYVIGGDGSMRAAHAIWTTAKRLAQPGEKPVSVIAVPKTMDNDILWVWQAFGFLSAVDRAREAIFHLTTEIKANPRLCVVQLFGSDSGFVVSHAVLGSGPGACDLALIPEVPFSMKGVCEHMLKRLRGRYNPPSPSQPYGMVVMAETAIPTDVDQYLDDPYVALTDAERSAIRAYEAGGRRVRGQTSDELRSGGLKVVSRILQRSIKAIPSHSAYWQDFRVVTNEPRHMIRATPPSAADVVVGQRLGALAVDNAMAGYTDFMISQWLTEFVLVPLQLVVLGRKRVPTDGIFWRSVQASTGQPSDLVS